MDYERALIADRKLRLLARDNLHVKTLIIKLSDIIEKYEPEEWKDIYRVDNKKLIDNKSMPKWKPAMEDVEAICLALNLPIRFSLK